MKDLENIDSKSFMIYVVDNYYSLADGVISHLESKIKNFKKLSRTSKILAILKEGCDYSYMYYYEPWADLQKIKALMLKNKDTESRINKRPFLNTFIVNCILKKYESQMRFIVKEDLSCTTQMFHLEGKVFEDKFNSDLGCFSNYFEEIYQKYYFLDKIYLNKELTKMKKHTIEELEKMSISMLNDVLHEEFGIEENLMRRYNAENLYSTFGDNILQLANSFLKYRGYVLKPEYYIINEKTNELELFSDIVQAKRYLVDMIKYELYHNDLINERG